MTIWTPWETCSRCDEKLAVYSPAGMCPGCISEIVFFEPAVHRFEGELTVEQTIGEPADEERDGRSAPPGRPVG
jgi:hypothetical protein